MAKQPTHHVVLQDKENKKVRNNVGVAWIDGNGWLSVKLSAGIRITAEMLEDRYYCSIYPTKEYKQKTREEMAPPAHEDDDEIPF